MNVFISHNKSDKETARFLAIALVEQGANVWFDEWKIRPGDSITGGIEVGLSTADIFVLVWTTLRTNILFSLIADFAQIITIRTFHLLFSSYFLQFFQANHPCGRTAITPPPPNENTPAWCSNFHVRQSA